MKKNISDKDKEDWENFTNSNEKLPNKDNKFSINKPREERILDLHGYTLENANEEIENFIKKSFEDRVYKIRVITGKGLHSQNEKNPYVSKEFGILKNSIPEFIKSKKNLMKIINKIENAKMEDGGSGAFNIYIKKNNI